MKVYLHNLGCAKNQKDGDIALSKFLESGYKFSNNPSKADIIIINTCGFIDEAKKEAISETLRLAEYKKQHCKYLIMMGCLSERYSEELFKNLKEVDLFVGVNNFDKICDYINFNKRQRKISKKSFIYEDSSYVKTILNNKVSNKFKNTAFVKISEGCSNFCSYCAIPLIRGALRYRSIESILKEIKTFLDSGMKEIILIGQDLTADNKFLKNLLIEISKFKVKPYWLRLMYCNPWGVDNELIKIIKDNDFICKYMDVPIQHYSDNVLTNMNRKNSSYEIYEIIQKLYENDIILRSTVMTGFPGETDEDFFKLKEFIEKEYFMWLGIFVYSPQEDTKAYGFKNKVNFNEALNRRNELDSLQFEITQNRLKSFIDKELDVIVDTQTEHANFECRAYFQAPEVDGLVQVNSLDSADKIVKVRVEETIAYDLIATKMKHHQHQ